MALSISSGDNSGLGSHDKDFSVLDANRLPF